MSATGRRAAAASALLVLLLTAPVASAGSWVQAGGAADRAGLAELRDSLLDAEREVTLDAFTISLGPGMVHTPHGAYVLTSNPVIAGFASFTLADRECDLVRLVDGAIAETRPVSGCASGSFLAGYDPLGDTLLVCAAGTAASPIIRALDARSLEERWSAAPGEPDAPSATILSVWRCGAPAIEPEARRLVVPFHANPGRNIVVAFDLDTGAPIWRTRVPASVFARVDPFFTPHYGDPSSGFAPDAVTSTLSGYALSGFLETSRGVVWLERDGTLNGGRLATVEPTPAGTSSDREEVPAASRWPAARGIAAAAVLGNELLVVDPASFTPILVPLDPLDPRPGERPAPVWTPSRLVVPTRSSLMGLGGSSFEEEWEWAAQPGGELVDVLAVPSRGEVWVVSYRALPGAPRYEVSRLSEADGRELQRLVVESSIFRTIGGRHAALIPAPDDRTLWLVLEEGRLIPLQARDDAAALEVQPAYPAVGETVRVRADSVDAERLLVAWGDGIVEELPADSVLEHVYHEPGLHRIVLTRLLADNTTSSTEALVRVGEVEPLALTPLQVAFSRENQEVTFFLLGLALTGGGALLALVTRRRRRTRLERDLSRLEAMVRQHASLPREGILVLEAERRMLRRLLAQGRLEDAHYAVLEARAARAVRAWRYRLLGPMVNRLSPHFRHLLDTVLEDARITSEEVQVLRAAVEHEAALAPEEHEALGALIDEWGATSASPA